MLPPSPSHAVPPPRYYQKWHLCHSLPTPSPFAPHPIVSSSDLDTRIADDSNDVTREGM
jgi:hypothetical protein